MGMGNTPIVILLHTGPTQNIKAHQDVRGGQGSQNTAVNCRSTALTPERSRYFCSILALRNRAQGRGGSFVLRHKIASHRSCPRKGVRYFDLVLSAPNRALLAISYADGLCQLIAAGATFPCENRNCASALGYYFRLSLRLIHRRRKLLVTSGERHAHSNAVGAELPSNKQKLREAHRGTISAWFFGSYTGVTSSWLLRFLGRIPKVQQKLL